MKKNAGKSMHYELTIALEIHTIKTGYKLDIVHGNPELEDIISSGIVHQVIEFFRKRGEIVDDVFIDESVSLKEVL